MPNAKQTTMPASWRTVRAQVERGELTMAVIDVTCDIAQEYGFSAFRDTGLPWLDGVTIGEEEATEIGYFLSVIRAIGRGEVEDSVHVWRGLFDALRLAWFCHVAEVDAAAWYRRESVLADMVGEVAK